MEGTVIVANAKNSLAGRKSDNDAAAAVSTSDESQSSKSVKRAMASFSETEIKRFSRLMRASDESQMQFDQKRLHFESCRHIANISFYMHFVRKEGRTNKLHRTRD